MSFPPGPVPALPVPPHGPADLLLREGAGPEVARRLPVLPDGLGPVFAQGAPADGGPTVSEAVYWLFQVKRLVHEGEELHEHLGTAPVGQMAVPGRLPMALSACGAAVRYAARILEQAIERSAPRPSAASRPQPQSSSIEALAWCRSACAVRAEAALCTDGANTMTVPAEVAERCAVLARECGRVFRLMADTAAFRGWSAGLDPLYRAWVFGGLAGASAPPPFFASCADLYTARPALAGGLGPDAWPPGAAGLPVGSLERYVLDAGGDMWAVVLAAPGDIDDPRNWPEASAALVAARAAPSGRATRCYLLAEGIHPQQTLPLIGEQIAGRYLEGLAVAVAPRAPALWTSGAQRAGGWGPGALTQVPPGLPYPQEP